MNRNLGITICLWTLSLFAPALAEGPLEYNRDVRPILAENCFACHGVDSAARKADLRLDRRDDAIDFGAITPDKPAERELIARILSDDPELVMPPPQTKKQLTRAQTEILRRWIREGAQYQPHWSFMPPSHPDLPAVANESLVRNVIDRFVLARLEQAGLEPAAEASPNTLFRRLHFDILGLPPKPDELADFVADYQLRKDLALADWIDRLMALPGWGEHRGRYWLDAARYADTHGLHFDNYREMWPYRDWVIRAFNANQPFDKFAVEQLAGDLLTEPSVDQLVATGFQRCNITTNEGGTIDAENLAIYATDRVQTFGWVFLGLTTNCAQCHDHKFDPISMQDYYSLAAFFRNTTAPAKDGNVRGGEGPILVVPNPDDRPRWDVLPAEISQAQQRVDQRKQQVQPEFEQWLTTATPGAVADISTDRLVIHVPLDEGTGNQVSNLAGSPDRFAAKENVKWLKNGKLGPAPVIKPKTTYDLGGAGDFEKDQAFSFGSWAMTPERVAKRGVSASIIARIDEENRYRGWDLWQEGTAVGMHLVDTWDKNAFKVLTSQGSIKPDQWQHLFVTYDGSGTPQGVKIYIDGHPAKVRIVKDTLKKDATVRTKKNLRIGQRSNSAVFAGGQVQDVRVYQRRLSDDEVLTLAQSVGVRDILAKSPDQRDQQDLSVLRDYYLTTNDDRYRDLTKAHDELLLEQAAISRRSPLTHIQEEKDTPAMTHILMRGAYDQLGEEVCAATPKALHAMPKHAPTNRLGLAQWVVDRGNPLTARVTVNRFWQEVFGQGLVVTPEDFGVSGALPSHPELLDWLANDFVDSGWDVKRFFKQMFMSATYRQAATSTSEKLQLDPHNELLSRGPRFRMDAEMVRDTALAVSGLLSPRMYGPGTRPYQPEDIWEIVGLPSSDTRKYEQDQGENLYRRTIYN
ncbi:MAG: DUF1549 domain-containing protein, partial [Bythopirellula sp.]